MQTKGIFRKTHGKDRHGRQQKSSKWYVEFRDHLDRVHRTPASTDRGASVEYLRNLRRLVELRTQSLPLPPELQRWVQGLDTERVERLVKKFDLLDRQWLAANEDLGSHITAWAEYLDSKGRTDRHVELYRSRVERLIAAVGVTRWPQLTTDGLRRAWLGLTTRTNKPLHPGTRNHYLVALKSFCRWMERTGRAASKPAAGIDAREVTERRERRPLSADEVRWLLRTTDASAPRFARRRDGGVHFDLTGPERATLYLFAVETGLRSSEIASLRVCDFVLDGNRPTVQLRAAYAKNRQAPPPFPLRTELVKRLRTAIAGKHPDAAALSTPGRLHAAAVLRLDLADARGAWIAAGTTPTERHERAASDVLSPTDARGRVVDFHALRSTTASWLAEAGVSPYAMQQIMRHADIKTTMAHYVKANPDVTRAALEQLPDLQLGGVA